MLGDREGSRSALVTQCMKSSECWLSRSVIRVSAVRNPGVCGAGPASRLARHPDRELVEHRGSAHSGQHVRRLHGGASSGARKPGLQTAEYVWFTGGYTAVKLDQEPFKDVRVRRAMGRASNWREFLESSPHALGQGAPNMAVPAASAEWAIPLAELTPEGLRAGHPGRQAAPRPSRLSQRIQGALREHGRLRPRLRGSHEHRAQELQGGGD